MQMQEVKNAAHKHKILLYNKLIWYLGVIVRMHALASTALIYQFCPSSVGIVSKRMQISSHFFDFLVGASF